MNLFKTREIYMKMCHQSKELHVLTDEEREKLQSHLRKMYQDIEAVCERHGLKVMLADGSVLGAIRHGGFIPWDDDIDLNMPRKDYDTFLKDYAKELPPNYKVFAPNSINGPISNFGKVVDMNTEIKYFDDDNQSEHYGIAVDIFPLESISPRRPIFNKLMRILSMALIYISASVSQYESNSLQYRKLMSGNMAGRFNYWFRQLLGFLFSFKPTKEWQNLFDRLVRNTDDTGYVHRPSDVYKWEPIPDEVYFPIKRTKFDNIQAYIPNNPEFLLKYDYGNWHYIPKPEERWEHFCMSIKFSKEKKDEEK